MSLVQEPAMHTPRLPCANMMPSVGALMDPAYLRCAVADASEPAHASASSRLVAPALWRHLLAAVRALQSRLVRDPARGPGSV